MVAQEFLEISGNQFFYAHDAINFSHSRSNRLSPGAEKCNEKGVLMSGSILDNEVHIILQFIC